MGSEGLVRAERGPLRSKAAVGPLSGARCMIRMLSEGEDLFKIYQCVCLGTHGAVGAGQPRLNSRAVVIKASEAAIYFSSFSLGVLNDFWVFFLRTTIFYSGNDADTDTRYACVCQKLTRV